MSAMTTPVTDTNEFKGVLFDALNSYFEEHGWVQRQAAEALGVPQTRVSEIKLRKNNLVSVDKLLRYCNALGINIVVGLVR